MVEVKAKKKDIDSMLRIVISSFEVKELESALKEIINNLERLEANFRGPIPLPTKTKKWTVNRSTFIYEESKEQYEMKVHRRLLDILNPDQKIVENLTNLSLPSGININVKMVN